MRSVTELGSPRRDRSGHTSRRTLCRQLLFASTLPFLGGCATTRSAYRSIVGGHDSAALLLPTTGAGAAIGQNMARAATLVAADAPNAGGTPIFDTADTVEGAGLAARKAIDGGARMLFGPLRADQTPPCSRSPARSPW